MPEYLAPGVYVEEFEIGAKPIEGVSTSTGGCLGKTERGPVEPRLVTSFPAFQRLYGGYLKDSYVAYAMDGFFTNGGQRCFIGRIVADGAGLATANLTDNGTNLYTINAIGPGDWGKGVQIKIEDATLSDFETSPPENPDLFKLVVEYYKDADFNSDPLVEEYDNLSPSETSSDSMEKRINDISNLIVVERLDTDTEVRPDNQTATLAHAETAEGALSFNDFVGNSTAGERTGLSAFEEVDEISLLFAPDENEITGVTGKIIGHCEKLKDRFAITSAPQAAGTIGKIRPPQDSKYAAYYYPWIRILDPVTNLNKLIPPAGHVAGIYARSDTERGVHKAPANEVVRGANDLQFQLLSADQALLNPRGINVIRTFIGRGIRVWGARTMSSDSLWKYINVRRLFIFVEESIEEGTQWVVFEPNDEKLWARVRQTITAFLTTVWRSGALMGTTAEEAFFVKCDRSTMTQDDIDNGRLICVIGIAPVKPAEFVIFRIAQWAGGSAVTE
jgi:phage tail sheath protein FI